MSYLMIANGLNPDEAREAVIAKRSHATNISYMYMLNYLEDELNEERLKKLADAKAAETKAAAST